MGYKSLLALSVRERAVCSVCGASSNIAKVINYYQNGATVSSGLGFNINLDHKPDINHFNIEKIDRLHATVIARIQSVMRSGSFWPGWEVHTTK